MTFSHSQNQFEKTTLSRRRRLWGAAVVVMLGVAALVATRAVPARADGVEAATASPGPDAATERSPVELRQLKAWLDLKAQTGLAMPVEARLAYRRGLIAWRSGEDAEAVSLLRGAAELDASYVAPHLTLAGWFLTREPSQALLSGAALVNRLRNDFRLQFELVGNMVFYGLHALFFGLLAAALILIGLHQHELRHVWRERLGLVLSARSAGMWSWAFLALPWVLGLGLVLPALVLLGMLWPVLKGRERALFLGLAVMVGCAPLAAPLMGRLALPLREGRAPFHGVNLLENTPYSAERHARITALARDHADSPFLRFGVAWMARGAGDLTGAEAAYRRTLERWPNNDRALNNLGNLLAMQGHFDEALKQYRQAVAIDPHNAAAHFNASQVYTRLFDYGAASDAVAKASALDFEMVRSYQARTGDDLPLVDQWLAPAMFWRALLEAPESAVPPLLPPAWRSMIEFSGWPFAALALGLSLVGIALGWWWQRQMPLRACSNCARPVCRRCAHRRRELALCPGCAAVAARAESPEFGRVLLLQQRRRVERARAIVLAAFATLVPGLGLLAARRAFNALGLLMTATVLSASPLGLRAPFPLDPGTPVTEMVGWGAAISWLLLYALSIAGFLGRAPEPAPPRSQTPGRPSSPVVDLPARAA